jgi:hypothetical protein
MDMNKRETDAMELSRTESILASEEPIVPSSGFLVAVMERVKEESAMPAPIPFPWKRALPGSLVAAAILGWGGVQFVRWGALTIKEASFAVPHVSPSVVMAITQPFAHAGWVALAAGISLASWLLARKIVGRPDAL